MNTIMKNPVLHGLRFTYILLAALFATSCMKEKQPEDPSGKDCNCNANSRDSTAQTVTFTNKQTGGKFTLQKVNDEYFLGGDMLLTQHQLDILKGGHQEKPDNNGRTFRAELTKLWPNRTVFYTINPGVPDAFSIQEAIDHWEANTNITFVQRTNQPNYIEFVPANVCASNIGMIGGRQEIRLSWLCFTGAIIHEIGHALGFFHEQMRDDRANWINIHTANIDPDALNNFQTYTQIGWPGVEIGTLDFNSIMMYSSDDFSINGLPTITRLDGSTFTAQRIGLSAGDIETYNYMYNPPFMRATYEEIYNYSDPLSGIYDYSWNIRVRFYQDAAFTTPYTLQYPITMLRYEYIEDLNGSTGGTHKVVLPVGTGEFVLGPSYYNEMNDFGTVVSKSAHRIGVAVFPGYVLIND